MCKLIHGNKINESEAVTITNLRKICFFDWDIDDTISPCKVTQDFGSTPPAGTETSHISPLSNEGTIPSGRDPGSGRWAQTRGPVIRQGDVGRFRGRHGIEESNWKYWLPHRPRSSKPVQELEEIHERLVQWNEAYFFWWQDVEV